MKKASVIGLLLLFAITAWAQVESGFMPFFVLQMKSELPKEVNETSGLFFHKGCLWTHNDSGGKPVLYALDTTTFEVVQRVTLSHAKNIDWEDVCTDDDHVFVGDFGNNQGNRKNLKIYMFPLSSLFGTDNDTIAVDSILFRFADQTVFEKKKKKHDFDCEAFFAGNDCLYLLSKGWETGTTRLYRLPKSPGTHVANVVNGFNSQGLITGADYDRDHGVLAIVGYVKSLLKPFMYLIFDFDEAGEKLPNRRFEMPQLAGAQTEGICFFADGRCYVSAETSAAMTARVFVADSRKVIAKNHENRKKSQKSTEKNRPRYENGL